MAQQHINYGAFPDDLNADAIRAAFQKSEDNFTELYAGSATAGVSRITAGPGILVQGSGQGTGNVTVSAALNAVNIVAGDNNILISGSPLRSSLSAITLSINTDPFTVNTINAQSAIQLNGQNVFSVLNGVVVLGGDNSQIDGRNLVNVTPTPYQDANAGITPSPGQIQYTSNVSGELINLGSNNFTFDPASNNLTTSNLTVTSNANINYLSALNGMIRSTSDSGNGNVQQGAFTVVGGVGIGGSISAGDANSNHTFYGTTNYAGAVRYKANVPTVSPNTGTIILENVGGISLNEGNIEVGGWANITNNVTIHGLQTTTALGQGSFIVDHGASIGGNLEVGGYANIHSNAQVGTDLVVVANAQVGANLIVSGDYANIGNALNVTGNTTIGFNYAPVNFTLEGNSLTIGNTVTVLANYTLIDGNDLTVMAGSPGGNVTIGAPDDVANGLVRTGNTTIYGRTTVDANLFVTGIANVTNNSQSLNTTIGAIVTAGGIGVAKDVNIGGNANVQSNLNVTGNAINVTVGNITVANAAANISARGLNTQIQYNNGGNLAGSANFTWNNGSSILTVNGGTGGGANITGTLTTANITYSGNLRVKGAASGQILYANAINSVDSSNLFIFDFANATLDLSGNINVSGNANLASNVRAGGNLTVVANTSLNVLTVSSTADVTGNLTVSANTRIVRSLLVGNGAIATSNAAAGEIRADNNITAYWTSDIRFKENIAEIPAALDKAAAVSGKLFDWTDEYIKNRGGEDGYFVVKRDVGVIAQDVQAVLPEAVRTKQDGTLAVDYPKLVALALAAVAEIKQELSKLKGKS